MFLQLPSKFPQTVVYVISALRHPQRVNLNHRHTAEYGFHDWDLSYMVIICLRFEYSNYASFSASCLRCQLVTQPYLHLLCRFHIGVWHYYPHPPLLLLYEYVPFQSLHIMLINIVPNVSQEVFLLNVLRVISSMKYVSTQLFYTVHSVSVSIKINSTLIHRHNLRLFLAHLP